MNKKGAFLTISVFLIFIGFISLFAVLQKQKISTYQELGKLSSADSVFYTYDSIEKGVSKLTKQGWDVKIVEDSERKTIFLSFDMPHDYDFEECKRFLLFAQEKSRHKINHTLDFNSILIMPYEITIEANSNNLITLPENKDKSLGRIEEYNLDLHYSGGASINVLEESFSSDGINLNINIYSSSGQLLDSYEKRIDPHDDSKFSINLLPQATPQPTKTINVSINSPGMLEIVSEIGTEIGINQEIILKKSNQTTDILLKNMNLSVTDNIYETWKKGEVKI